MFTIVFVSLHSETHIKRLTSSIDKKFPIIVIENSFNHELKKELEAKYSNVKVINTASTGLNHIDLDYCKKNKIDVWSLKEDYELINDLPSTSELAFGLMSSILRNIPSSFEDVKVGGWDYDMFMGHQLKGKKIGVIGGGKAAISIVRRMRNPIMTRSAILFALN